MTAYCLRGGIPDMTACCLRAHTPAYPPHIGSRKSDTNARHTHLVLSKLLSGLLGVGIDGEGLHVRVIRTQGLSDPTESSGLKFLWIQGLSPFKFPTRLAVPQKGKTLALIFPSMLEGWSSGCVLAWVQLRDQSRQSLAVRTQGESLRNSLQKTQLTTWQVLVGRHLLPF